MASSSSPWRDGGSHSSPSPPNPPTTTRRTLTHRSTNPLVWFAAIVCAILAVLVFVAGVVVLFIYLTYRPQTPYVRVCSTHLDGLGYDRSGLLQILLTIDMEAVDENEKTVAAFSDADFQVEFARTPLAALRAAPFVVGENGTLPLHYLVASARAPLDKAGMEKMETSLKRGQVEFGLRRQARTRWNVGVFLSMRSWARLNCKLRYFYPNGSTTGLDCSKSHFM
ncbi:unnamed protein product [Spirodela intermedia]|uniref:Uncharacterized protein n=1 Tax=Spirodela intermedia TaxID=51605 RepID=A0A7I8L9I3_SPIIN|nr:unnamed protein product [Spirodela intermedia]